VHFFVATKQPLKNDQFHPAPMQPNLTLAFSGVLAGARAE